MLQDLLFYATPARCALNTGLKDQHFVLCMLALSIKFLMMHQREAEKGCLEKKGNSREMFSYRLLSANPFSLDLRRHEWGKEVEIISNNKHPGSFTSFLSFTLQSAHIF